MFGWSRGARTHCHLYEYVRRKLSWEAVAAQQRFRPKTTHPDLRRDAIGASLRGATRDALLLSAAHAYDILLDGRNRRTENLSVIGSELLMVECVLFSICGAVAYLNPQEDTWETFHGVRQRVIGDLFLMTLISDEDLEALAEAREDLYGRRTDKPGNWLADAFSRVLACRMDSQVASDTEIDLLAPHQLPLLMTTATLADQLFEVTKGLVSEFVKVEMEGEYP